MKFAVCVLTVLIAVVLAKAESDAGHFIPKAFYTLDSDGHRSNLHAVNPHTANYLRRLRRQAVSSTSPSVTGSDGITHFPSQVLNSHTPQIDFSSRFGGSSDDTSSTGQITQTSGVIDREGKSYYRTHEDQF